MNQLKLIYFLPTILMLYLQKVVEQVWRWQYQKCGFEPPKALVRLREYNVRSILVKQSKIKYLLQEEDNMIRINKKQEFVNYVPISERALPKDEQTVFVMKVLSRRKLLETQQEAVKVARDGQISMPLTIGVDTTVRQLSGWQNVCDEDGNPLPFSPEKRSELFDFLPLDLQEELTLVFQSGKYNADAELEVELQREQQAIESEQRRNLRDAYRGLRHDASDEALKPSKDEDAPVVAQAVATAQEATSEASAV